MSKRGPSEYLTKDHGSIPTDDSNDTSVKMATAAQLASRKLAKPRGRTGASRPAQPSPFNGITSNQSTAQATQPQQSVFSNINGTTTFGGSQSFPPNTTASSGPFNFQPPQSSSFTFGMNSSTPNPFSNLNGNADTLNNTQPEDTMMESPQKKSTFGGFSAATNNGNTNGGTGTPFAFGQATKPQQPSVGFNFGTSTSNDFQNNVGASSFGSNTASQDTASKNVFGQPSQNQPFGGFGQTAPVVKDQTPKFNFGQSQPSQGTNGLFNFGSKPENQSSDDALGKDSKTKNTSTSGPQFSFGQTSGVTATNNLFNGFGQPDPEVSKPSSSNLEQPRPFSQSTPNLFGQPSSSSDSSAPANPFASLFSQNKQDSAVTSQSSSAGPPKPTFNFGAPPTTDDSSKVSSATVAKETPNMPSTNSIDSQNKPLFAFNQNSTTTTTAAPSQTTGSSNPFNFGSNSKSAFQTSSSSEDASSASTASNPPKSLFNFSSSQTPSSGGLFTPAKPIASGSGNTGGLFGQSQSVNTNESQNQTQTNSSTVDISRASNLFNPKPVIGSKENQAREPPSNSESEKTPSWAGTNPFASVKKIQADSSFSATPRFDTDGDQGRSAAKQPATSEIQSQATPTPKAFPKSTSSGKAPLSDHPGTNLAGDSSKPSLSTAAPPTDSQVDPNPKRQISAQAPARIPTYLNGEGYKEYDSNYRLHSLNREFQKRIAAMDPVKHDFENVIRHYVAVRESIGASVGLYIRNIAGTKRKNDEAEDRSDIPAQYKRARPDSVPEANTPKPAPTPSFNSFQSSQQSVSSEPKPITLEKPSNTSKSTEMFRSMIPESSSKTSPIKSGSPSKIQENSFASLQSASTSSKNNIFDKTEAKGSSSANAPSFGQTPHASTTPVKSPPKKPVFEVPKFGSGTTFNHMAAFGKTAAENAAKLEKENREKRKAEEFDSDEDDLATYNKQLEEESRQKRAKISAIPKTGFKPTFGSQTSTSSGSGFNFGPQTSTDKQTESIKPSVNFGGNASPSKAKATETANTNSQVTDFGLKNDAGPGHSPNEPLSLSDEEDNNEDDEGDQDMNSEEIEDEEGQSGSSYQDEGQSEVSSELANEDDLPEDEIIEDNETEDDDDNDLQTAMNRSVNNKGKSLFDRIEPNPKHRKSQATSDQKVDDVPEKPAAKESEDPILQDSKNSSFQPSIWGSHIGKSTPETPGYSPITPAQATTTSKEQFKPAATFNFNATPPASTPPNGVEGASIFAGGAIRPVPVPFEGMFGSRPSTPSNVDTTAADSNSKSAIFGQSTGTTDHTWKPGSAIKFGSPENHKETPIVNITAPSPSGKEDANNPKSFSNLFGSKAPTPRSTEGPGSLGFTFGGPNTKLAPGLLGAAPHLVNSANSSAMSSRATSPGLTDNESVATNETEDLPNDPQTSLMDSRAGEENDDCLWEGRSKALKFISNEAAENTKFKGNEWNTVGVGILRILKNKDTSKTRVILRADPNASVVVNALFMPQMTYETVDQGKSGALKGALYQNDKLDKWVFKFKTKEMAEAVRDIVEKNKS